MTTREKRLERLRKALKILESEIGFKKAKSKEKAKKIKGNQKIEFIGRPNLPSIANDIKRIMSNPEAVAITFRSLEKLGLQYHLKFLLKASFYAVRDSDFRKLYSYSKVAIDQIPNFGVTLDQPSWESYRKILTTALTTKLKKRLQVFIQ
jgi:hypothetical protein